MPLALTPGSSSTLATPLAFVSWAALTPAGSRVAVWNPSTRNWIVEPVGTLSVRGKKSLNAQLWPAGTAAGMSAVIVSGDEAATGATAITA